VVFLLLTGLWFNAADAAQTAPTCVRKTSKTAYQEPAAQAQSLDALQRDLQAKSDQGRKGITPEMAAEIVDTLMKQQGSVSPDMSELLNALQKDGASLSGDTFRRLQDAARKADASGLDLGVSPDIKESLLKGQPAPAPAAPGLD
jgi:hypothetical protein